VIAWYLDTSAFMKLVADEPESAAMVAWLDGCERRDEAVLSSDLLRAEARRVARRSIDAAALSSVLAWLERLDLVPISGATYDDAGLVDPPALRALDAIHLAVALTLGDDLGGVVTYDRRLAEAAAIVGVETLSPGQ
jgi:uncharacterized protein